MKKFGYAVYNGRRKAKALIYSVCEGCGKPVKRWPSLRNKRDFCSHACYGKWGFVNYRGENNPNWKGGITAISSQGLKTLEWRATQKRLFLEFPFCFICDGIKNLHAHHIIPRRVSPDLIYDYDNVATVCRGCHSRIKGREREWETYLRGRKRTI